MSSFLRTCLKSVRVCCPKVELWSKINPSSSSTMVMRKQDCPWVWYVSQYSVPPKWDCLWPEKKTLWFPGKVKFEPSLIDPYILGGFSPCKPLILGTHILSTPTGIQGQQAGAIAGIPNLKKAGRSKDRLQSTDKMLENWYGPAKNGWFRWFRTRESWFANPALKWFGLFGLGGFHVGFLVGIWADHLYFLQKQNSNLSVSSLKDSLSLGAESSPPDPSTFALPSHAPVTTCQTWRGPQESTEMSQKILSGERFTLITSIKNMQKYTVTTFI